MTIAGYIKQRFSYIGEMSDAGASDFALDFGLNAGKEASSEDKKLIGTLIDGFIEKNILHPTSVCESGFSASWSVDSIKTHIKLLLKKYGIDLNEETAAIVGLSVIKDVSDIW